MEPVGLKSYMLIRVGLNVREDEWFGLSLGMPEVAEEQEPESKAKRSRLLCVLEKLRLHGGRRRNRRLEAPRMCGGQQERERILAERIERIRQTDMAVERLAGEVLELAEDRRGCRLVYEGAVRKALAGVQRSGGTEPEKNPACGEIWQEQRGSEEKGPVQGRMLRELWNRHFDMEEFQDYEQRFWIDRLLPYARLCHYVILGTAPCICEIIRERAPGMKSLRWMLLEADCSQELQDFVEDFYTEYGLAIELRIFESQEAFRRQRDLCGRPSNIMDFTGDVCFFAAEAAEGCIWLDMFSSEEKRYRLQRRGAGVEYVSLKEEWKRAKRRCAAPVWSCR